MIEWLFTWRKLSHANTSLLLRGKSVHGQTGLYGMNPALCLSPTTVFFMLFNGYVSAEFLSLEFWLLIVNIVHICNNSRTQLFAIKVEPL